MTTVKVKRKAKRHHGSSDKNRMTIASSSGNVIVKVPYSPSAGTYTNLAPDWQELNRTSRDPLVVRNNDPRPRMNFTLYFGHQDWTVRVDDQLRKLSSIARGGQKVRVSYSSWESGLWRISSLQFDVIQRHPINNEITRANVQIEFILVEDITEFIGPLTGGVKNTGGSGNSGSGNTTGKGRNSHRGGKASAAGSTSKPRRYTIKSGDTLSEIAVRYYHDASMWRKIASANKINNPRKLKVGKVLRLP